MQLIARPFAERQRYSAAGGDQNASDWYRRSPRST
jgi:hypothetical protein